MSSFECSVKELNGHGGLAGLAGLKEEKTSDSSETKQIKKNTLELNSSDSTIKTEVSQTILSKLTEEKNIKLILLVVIGYLITTSLPFLELLMKTIPYVMTSATETNIIGKILSAVLIGIAVIFFTSFFPDQ